MPIKNLEELTLEHNKTNRWKDLLSLLACVRGLTSEEADMAERLEMSKFTYFKYKVIDRWGRLWQGNRYKFNMRHDTTLAEVMYAYNRTYKSRSEVLGELAEMRRNGIITDEEFNDSWGLLWNKSILKKDRIYKTREDFEEVMAKIEQMKKEEEKNKRERFMEAITNAIDRLKNINIGDENTVSIRSETNNTTNNFGSSSSDVRKEKNED